MPYAFVACSSHSILQIVHMPQPVTILSILAVLDESYLKAKTLLFSSKTLFKLQLPSGQMKVLL